MFGPSGDLTGSSREYWEALTTRIEKLARSLLIPPVPRTETLLKLSTSDNGLVSSKIVESWLLLKNSLREAINGLALIKLAGSGLSSGEIKDIFSLTDLSRRRRPTLKALTATSSPTRLKRLLAKWSISSSLPTPFCKPIK